MKHYSILYLATFVIMMILDIAWLRGIAKEFYQSRIGDMLAFRAAPALLFYVMYVVGVLIFVSANSSATSWQSVALYGAFFGFVAYATYDLTNMATLQGWSWAIVGVDIAWGTFNTAFSATAGWLIARYFQAT